MGVSLASACRLKAAAPATWWCRRRRPRRAIGESRFASTRHAAARRVPRRIDTADDGAARRGHKRGAQAQASASRHGIGNLCLTNPALCYGTGQGYPGRSDHGVSRRTAASSGSDSLPPHGRGGPVHRAMAGAKRTQVIFARHGKSSLTSTATAGACRKHARRIWPTRSCTGTANKDLSRDNPNAADRLDKEMQNAYPDAKKLGPGSITIFKF